MSLQTPFMQKMINISNTVGNFAQIVGTYQGYRSAASAERYNIGALQGGINAIEQTQKYQRYVIGNEQKSMLGTQKVRYAASGLRLEGSALEVMADSWSKYEMDKALSDYNASVDISRKITDIGYKRYLMREYKRKAMFETGGKLLQVGADYYTKYMKKKIVKEQTNASDT